tara:strand:- start:957 stop:1799 length:843 start_codon:yes stop_codon:yes gene_type:complete
MDDQKQRFCITGDDGDCLSYLGWEVENKDDLKYFAEKLENSNIKVFVGNKALSDQRFVEEIIYFFDPSNNRIELLYNPQKDQEPFKPGRPISGFKTGVCGLGHAVLHTDNISKLVPFYRDLLEFNVSDYSFDPINLYFFHVNERHHSFALIETGRQGFHHFMVEYNNLDDVGQGYDLIQFEENAVAYTLGRHTNDYMTSFYSVTPSGFFVENGWGGRIINPNTWKSSEMTEGPSFWGHERLHMPEDQRLKFRKKRLEAAASGKQAPAFIDCPWLYSNMKR